ncbi:MAG: S-methyl-5-thioribose-1-phosphate isomerase [Nitrospirales bacterium]|nr:S-methyl-5-thioribose-1-phosphate isomerase [Nitrospira sp.]MDR4502429.1 S-methyl-5-thioribose-1-phosphate isomerase [Nitrospirales bacterium]
MIPTVEWGEDSVNILDQSLLPGKIVVLQCCDYQSVIQAIRELRVRGAPAIGVTAAMGLALGAKQICTASLDDFRREFDVMCTQMSGARPTAVNLFWAIERMKNVLLRASGLSPDQLKQDLIDEAQAICREDIARNQAIGEYGAALIEDGQTILTHCNAGALATAGYGTALGVIRSAWRTKKHIHVFADETRPVLQGARLTTWELLQDGIPTTLITDNAAGALMRQGKIHVCLVGADRIAANGDVANKIGTYTVAVLAKTHGLPFYVAAPTSTIDMDTLSGEQIPIEQRDSSEVTTLYSDRQIAPAAVEVLNPAFDITPAELITGIITERGVVSPSKLSTLQS